jgi:transposase
MSMKELKRAEVLARVKAGALSVRKASEILGVSYRQAKRLWKGFRRRGAIALRHGNAGRRSNRRTAAALRRRVLRVVRREFGGDATHERFGPTLAAEHLAEEYRLVVHHETLRRWMLAAGLWTRVRRAPLHRQRRERKAHFGELVQLDGSFESWLEDRGPTACLMHLVDDATGRCGLRFEPQETIWGAVRSLRSWIGAYGIPVALYTDWKNVYVRKPTAAELGSGAPPLTQFGRMCATLGIRIIAASSPQAKGRVERGHGTHQDRLVKKLRRRKIADYAAANTFLATTYVAHHNARFAQAPRAPEDFHTPVPAGVNLEQVFRLETERTVNNDWVIRHHNHLLQLERHGRQYPPARSTVLVCEYEDGHVEVWYRGAAIPWRDITGQAHRPPIGLTASRPTSPAPPRPKRPGAEHPWRRLYREMPDRLSPGERLPGHIGRCRSEQESHVRTAAASAAPPAG